MKRLDRIIELLDALVGGQVFGAHGAFWRGLSIDQLATKKVFGYPVLVRGDSSGSNIIKALRGEPPFGSDVGTPGALFRRMPAGRTPATDTAIDYIARWIDDGCPDEDDPGMHLFAIAGHQDPQHHNAYWREFDNWAMFNPTQEIQDAIGDFFPVVEFWFAFSKSPAKEAAWNGAIQAPNVQQALQFLSRLQRDTVEKYYGQPIDLDDLWDSYKRFGKGILPPDPLRPQDPNHQMNGRQMWFFWAAFGDACLRSNIDLAFWEIESRAILVGLLHDGLFRGRFRVVGFAADEAGSDGIVEFAKSIPASDLQRELSARLVQSGL